MWSASCPRFRRQVRPRTSHDHRHLAPPGRAQVPMIMGCSLLGWQPVGVVDFLGWYAEELRNLLDDDVAHE